MEKAALTIMLLSLGRPLRFKLGNHKQFMGLGARMSLRSVHLEMAKPAEVY